MIVVQRRREFLGSLPFDQGRPHAVAAPTHTGLSGALVSYQERLPRGAGLCDDGAMAAAPAGIVDDVRRLIAAHSGLDDVVVAFVFGSLAWGDAGQGSDIDVLVILDRDDDFREVQRVRVADLLDDQGSLPMFADIDRMAFARFAAAVERDGLIHRVVNSIVIIDDGRYQPIRERATRRLADPSVRTKLVSRRIESAKDHIGAAGRLVDSDCAFAILQARLGAEEAATALVEASGGRASVPHLIEGFGTAVGFVGRQELVGRLQSALALGGGVAAAEVGLESYRTIAERLREWLADPQVARGLGPEHVAWAEFTYSAQTYTEFEHKVTALTHSGRTAEGVLYVDGLLRVPLRINTSKVFGFRQTGRPKRLSIPDFHLALKAEPDLYRAWIAGLRLDGDRDDVLETIEVAREILTLNAGVIAATTAPTPEAVTACSNPG